MTAPAVERLVLALDELIRTGRYEEFAEQARAHVSVGLLDQFDAATAQTDRGLQKIAALTGSTSGYSAFGELPGWVTLGLLHALVAWQAGRGSTCMHSPDPRRPAPVTAAAWRPGLVTCARCAHLLATRPDTSADRTCDGCGHITTGPEHSDGIFPAALAAGPFTYLLGVCSSCKWWSRHPQPHLDPNYLRRSS